MDVGRAHGVAVQQVEQLVARAVGGQAVGRRVVAVEVILAVLVGAELAAEVVVALILRVLEVVLAVGRGLPDVKDGARDALARRQVRDGAVHLGDAAARARVLDDGATQVAEGRVGRPERPQDGRRGGVDIALGNDLVGDLVNEPVRFSRVSNAVRPIGSAGGGQSTPKWECGNTHDSKPSTSEMRWASFLVLVEIWPIELTKCTPAIHSSVVSSTSRAKSCRWRRRALKTTRLRSVTLGPMVLMQWSVKPGSNRLAGLASPLVPLVCVPFVAMLTAVWLFGIGLEGADCGGAKEQLVKWQPRRSSG